MTRKDSFIAGKERRALFRRVFCDGEDGKTALAIILNRLGYFATDPAAIHPELQAAANYILGEIGSLHHANLYALVDKIASASTDDDLQAFMDAGDPNEEL